MVYNARPIQDLCNDLLPMEYCGITEVHNTLNVATHTKFGFPTVSALHRQNIYLLKYNRDFSRCGT